MKPAAVLLIATFAAVLRGIASSHGDHLEPADDFISSSQIINEVHEIAAKNSVQEVRRSAAVMLSQPAFVPEMLVYLSINKGSAEVVSCIGNFNFQPKIGENAAKLELKTKALSPEITDKIILIFALVTSSAQKAPNARVGVDGTCYYFSTFTEEAGNRSRMIWDPPSTSLCGELIALGDSMHRYVREDLPAADIASSADALLRRLRQ